MYWSVTSDIFLNSKITNSPVFGFCTYLDTYPVQCFTPHFFLPQSSPSIPFSPQFFCPNRPKVFVSHNANEFPFSGGEVR